jgi:hypothetical protein
MVDSERDMIDGILRTLDLPEEVIEWDIEIGSDATDESAAWITLVIDDGQWNEEWLRQTGRDLRHRIRRAIQNSAVDCWPYLTLMTESDFRALQSEKSMP